MRLSAGQGTCQFLYSDKETVACRSITILTNTMRYVFVCPHATPVKPVSSGQIGLRSFLEIVGPKPESGCSSLNG